MKRKLKVATVFSGIGSIEFALKRLGIDYEVCFACDNGEVEVEYDKDYHFKKIKELDTPTEKKEYVEDLYRDLTSRKNFVKQSYYANYEDNLIDDMFFNDIRLLDGSDFHDEVDLFVGGSPCQSFSTVGFQSGLEDARGTLFYEFARLIEEIQPKVFIYENVRGIVNHDKKNTWKIIEGVFKSLGYNVDHKILNSKNFGIPQNRNRLFLVGTKSKEISLNNLVSKELKFTAQDFLINNNDLGSMKSSITGEITLDNITGKIDKKYILTPKLYAYVMKGGTKSFYQKPEIDLPIARTVLKTMGNRHRAGIDNYYTHTNGKVRMLSEREAHRLMGFTDDYKIVVSRAQGYKQAGNSIVVDVFMAIMNLLIKESLFL